MAILGLIFKREGFRVLRNVLFYELDKHKKRVQCELERMYIEIAKGLKGGVMPTSLKFIPARLASGNSGPHRS